MLSFVSLEYMASYRHSKQGTTCTSTLSCLSFAKDFFGFFQRYLHFLVCFPRIQVYKSAWLNLFQTTFQFNVFNLFESENFRVFLFLNFLLFSSAMQEIFLFLFDFRQFPKRFGSLISPTILLYCRYVCRDILVGVYTLTSLTNLHSLVKSFTQSQADGRFIGLKGK